MQDRNFEAKEKKNLLESCAVLCLSFLFLLVLITMVRRGEKKRQTNKTKRNANIDTHNCYNLYENKSSWLMCHPFFRCCSMGFDKKFIFTTMGRTYFSIPPCAIVRRSEDLFILWGNERMRCFVSFMPIPQWHPRVERADKGILRERKATIINDVTIDGRHGKYVKICQSKQVKDCGTK